jgi:histidinol-phosphate aminotransferase
MAAMEIDVVPSGANFVLFRPRHRTGRDVWQGLLDRSVLVRDCSGWPRLTDCLRVTVGTPGENDAFLAALAEVLA